MQDEEQKARDRKAVFGGEGLGGTEGSLEGSGHLLRVPDPTDDAVLGSDHEDWAWGCDISAEGRGSEESFIKVQNDRRT